MTTVRVALALGSNLGDRLRHLRAGVTGIAGFVDLEAASSVYETAPVGFVEQPPFLNAVIVGSTVLDLPELLDAVHGVEAAAGRRRTFRNAPRVLDVDVVLYGQEVVRGPRIQVPHPRWMQRSFVMGPLAEAAPFMVDPVTGRTVQEIWEARRTGLPPLEPFAPSEALWREAT